LFGCLKSTGVGGGREVDEMFIKMDEGRGRM